MFLFVTGCCLCTSEWLPFIQWYIVVPIPLHHRHRHRLRHQIPQSTRHFVNDILSNFVHSIVMFLRRVPKLCFQHFCSSSSSSLGDEGNGTENTTFLSSSLKNGIESKRKRKCLIFVDFPSTERIIRFILTHSLDAKHPVYLFVSIERHFMLKCVLLRKIKSIFNLLFSPFFHRSHFRCHCCCCQWHFLEHIFGDTKRTRCHNYNEPLWIYFRDIFDANSETS